MNEVVKFLNENPVQYLATVGRDGKAKCRPFMFAGEKDGKLWFCTNNQKDVYKDMQANPNIEVSVSSPAYAWIRLNGKAVFENNMPVKEMCIQNPIVKGQYQTADNPIFEVFYLADAHAVIADFSGNPPKEYDLSAGISKYLRGKVESLTSSDSLRTVRAAETVQFHYRR